MEAKKKKKPKRGCKKLKDSALCAVLSGLDSHYSFRSWSVCEWLEFAVGRCRAGRPEKVIRAMDQVG